MVEIIEPGVLETPKPRRKLQISDIVVFGILLVIIVVLAVTLISKLSLKHDVANGKAVTDQVVADIAKRDGGAARKLGTAKFQSTYTSAVLTAQFKAIEPVTSHARSVDRQTLQKTKDGKTVYVIYKYPTKDLAFYIRVAVIQKADKWQLTNISGNADESQLIVK